jgi:glycosyltransferase involved in cell wall biosynthesis
MPKGSWRVTSFQIDEFFKIEGNLELNKEINYTISLSNPRLPPLLDKEVIWFEHSFGIWGEESSSFLSLLKEARGRGRKTLVTLHTIHFQSPETPQGLQKKEKKLLEGILPLVDAITVFTRGAYQAVIGAFPEYKGKAVVIRHGVNFYPKVKQKEARKRFLNYLTNRVNSLTKEELKFLQNLFFTEKVILLGSWGFITKDKDPLKIYQLREILQPKLPQHKVVAIFTGRIQKRTDKKIEESLSILEKLKSIHDGRENFFFEDYIPEEILPFFFQALDYVIFWPNNATQSGRMSHAQGTNTCILGRDIEGIGETLKLSGLPAVNTLEELAEKIELFTLKPELKEKILRANRYYAQRFSFEVQAQKHLLLKEVVLSGKKIPTID